ncbi:MAG: hypothetical protein J1F33_05030 [Clostridiales bacterium]|nr:hypothetical protein [Clostridiales bacterium]
MQGVNMQYHIQTAPLWDAYREDGCPICRLYGMREDKLISQYLSDNVMDPDFRVASNDKGFCKKHIDMMYGGQNKLGLALQLETRAAAVNALIKAPTDKKSAKKFADKLKAHRGCVICDALDELMPRYYMTVAQMYSNEPEFPELFLNAEHCLSHAIELYAAAEFAGKSAQAYCAALSYSLKRDLKRTESELRDFADCFDHKNAGSRPDPTAIPRAIKLLITK